MNRDAWEIAPAKTCDGGDIYDGTPMACLLHLPHNWLGQEPWCPEIDGHGFIPLSFSVLHECISWTCKNACMFYVHAIKRKAEGEIAQTLMCTVYQPLEFCAFSTSLHSHLSYTRTWNCWTSQKHMNSPKGMPCLIHSSINISLPSSVQVKLHFSHNIQLIILQSKDKKTKDYQQHWKGKENDSQKINSVVTTSFCYLCHLLDQWKWFSKFCNQSIKDWNPWEVQQLLHLWHPTYMQWDFHWQQGAQPKALISFWD